jgi:PAS domain-containing protein
MGWSGVRRQALFVHGRQPEEGGSERTTSIQSAAFTVEQSQPCWLQSFLRSAAERDERLHHNSKLRESEDRGSRILQRIGGAFIVTDEDAQITRMNPIAEVLTLRKLTEVLSSVPDFLKLFLVLSDRGIFLFHSALNLGFFCRCSRL